MTAPADPPPRAGVLTSRALRRLAFVLLAAVSLVGTALPASALMTGVDVASWQHTGSAPIDWSAVRSAGHSFAFIKATEGTTYVNPWFAKDWAGAGAAGLFRGAYHFARPALPVSTAVDQARYFVAATGTMAGASDLPPVLDLEVTGGLSQTDLANWTRTWLAEVQRLTGKSPIIYVGYYFWRDSVGNPTDIGAQYRLWLPSYPSDPNSTTFRPLVPAGWPTWTFWQYTSQGTVPGISGGVDLNRYCCDMGNLAALGGSAAGAGNPFGSLDAVQRGPSQVRVQGWAIDPDSTSPINVHVYVDGVWAGQATASVDRPDVGSAYPGFGSGHGYDVTLPIGAGSSQVCVYAINVGAGSTNPLLGCQTLPGDPFGNLESASASGPGTVEATGWAVDPSTSAPDTVDLTVDGVVVASAATSVARPDVVSAFPFAGPTSGFDIVAHDVPGGVHQVCAIARNIGSGTHDQPIGCNSVTVPQSNPIGNLESAQAGLGSARISGWALDPDTTAPIYIHVYVDGVWGGQFLANGSRPDVGQVYAAAGSSHGFDLTLPMATGTHQVCVYGINSGPVGSNSGIGCRTVVVPSDPVGNIDTSARYLGLAQVSGWAIDPDTSAPISVRVYVDGAYVTTALADVARPDVGDAFPAYGPDHGFAPIFGVSPGPHQVCVYGVNVGAGSANPPPWCTTI